MKKNILLTLAILALLVAGLSLQAAVTRTSTPAIGPFGAASDCTGGDGTGGAALSDSIAFTEVSSGMTDVNVRVAFDHSFRGDLQFHVTYSGGGGVVILAADDGAAADDYYATFDDEAGASCASAGACGAGTTCSAANTPGPTCTPDTALSAFDSLATPGTFSLVFCDDAGGDSGTLVSWAVTANGPGGLPVELLEFDIQ
jgi:subtilisin-like proprotein convertase family protein